MTTFMTGAISRETAIEIKDYPYGFTLRTSLFIWIEHSPKKGYRVCRQTINPKTNKENKPKKSTYASYYALYENDEGLIKSYCYNGYSIDSYLKAKELGAFETKEIEANFGEKQRILSIKGMAIYGGFDFDKIKDFNLEEINKISKEDTAEFKTEEGAKPGYSPFKVTQHTF